MDFLGIGPLELLLILIVTLIIFGPGKLPEMARTLGKTMRAIRKASSELTTAVTRELEASEKTTSISQPKPPVNQPREIMVAPASSPAEKSAVPGQDNQPAASGGNQQQNE